jgi:hypothetical protein
LLVIPRNHPEHHQKRFVPEGQAFSASRRKETIFPVSAFGGPKKNWLPAKRDAV